jgi:hypothetical protein
MTSASKIGLFREAIQIYCYILQFGKNIKARAAGKRVPQKEIKRDTV